MTEITQTTPSATPPRPQKHDKDIMATVAKRLLSEVVNWMGGSEYDDEDDIEDEEDEILNDLTRTLRDSYDLDGFKLAKQMEEDNHCIEADSELVDIMGQASRIAYVIAEEKTEAWVVANNIAPAFKVGDHVTFEHGLDERRSGTIAAIRSTEGQYTIQEDGRHYQEKDAGGWIVDYEKVLAEVGPIAANGVNA